MTDREAYIALNMISGLGPIKVKALIDCLGAPQKVFEADAKELLVVRGVGQALCEAVIEQRSQINVDEELDNADSLGVRVITPLDDEYPDILKTIHNPPLALYVKGSFTQQDKLALGIVGSRKATHYGLSVADRFSYQLAQTGFTVVSGLAHGIDTASHEGALKAKGRTIAVLGSAIDQLYPTENRDLAEQIEKSGAVISEYPLGRQADRQTFPYRNRIISGLSMGVLVVEASAKSGSLHTADSALEQGRSVFAIPGRIDHSAARGTNRLIKNGAKLVDNLSDILEEFDLLVSENDFKKQKNETSARLEVSLLTEEKRVVEVLWHGESDVDSLCREVGLSSADMSGILLGLEMKRVIRMLPGRRVELADDLRG